MSIHTGDLPDGGSVLKSPQLPPLDDTVCLDCHRTATVLHPANKHLYCHRCWRIRVDSNGKNGATP